MGPLSFVIFESITSCKLKKEKMIDKIGSDNKKNVVVKAKTIK